jgi:hypothetical protein
LVHACFPKASASFLKKRSKKLLLNWACGYDASTVQRSKSFFASFFSKKEALTCLPCLAMQAFPHA